MGWPENDKKDQLLEDLGPSRGMCEGAAVRQKHPSVAGASVCVERVVCSEQAEGSRSGRLGTGGRKRWWVLNIRVTWSIYTKHRQAGGCQMHKNSA